MRFFSPPNTKNMPSHTTTTLSEEFSLFENHLSTQASTTTVAEVYQKIIGTTSPSVGITQSIHAIYSASGGGKKGKKAIAPLKAHLPVAAFGATDDRKVVPTPSGLICVEICVNRKLHHPLIPGALVRGRSLHPDVKNQDHYDISISILFLSSY